jgi:type VI secretion system protein ImpF
MISKTSRPAVGGRDQLLPSLLDRLLDDQPETREEPRWHDGLVIKTLKHGVCRDVQNMLNARRPLDDLPEAYLELRNSLVNYGLPDLQSLEIREDHELEHLCRTIAALLEAFEPRLRRVVVTPDLGDEGRRPLDRRLRFTIEALLVVEPLREGVRLSSAIDATSGDFQVEPIL